MERVCTEKAVKKDSMETEDEGERRKGEGEKGKQDDVPQKAWQPSFYIKVDKEIHYFAGHEISIWQSLDSYGSIIWPATLALCQFLDTNRGTVNLLDKAVLEIGAGTGLVSIVASLLGAWVTASDLPEVLANLRSNLSRNTRGRCRYTPQVAELSWGFELEQTYPRSIYRYDYVLAADVVQHNDFSAELLATMHHFCQPGTTLIWSNKIRFGSDAAFLENFKNAFNTTLLADMGEINIYSATTKEPEATVMLLNDEEAQKDKVEEKEEKEEKEEEDTEEFNIGDVSNLKRQDQKQTLGENRNIEETNDDYEVESKEIEDDSEMKENSAESHEPESNAQAIFQTSWAPCVYYRLDKEIHYFMGHKITIQESIDSYGAMIWPAAVALSKFLETPAGQEQINLLDQETLELGAGTGLLSIVATLLGAKLTATDLPDVLGNLKSNLNRNTKGHRKHEPQVVALSWGHELEQSFPHTECHYDYVLAADVVYHHDFLEELLFTMLYFCQPGTTLIWANKVRYPSDLVFIENFQKAFQTTLLAELDEVRIYLAVYRAQDQKDYIKTMNKKGEMEKEHNYRNEKRNEKERLRKQDCKEAKEEIESQGTHADKQSPEGEEAPNEKDFHNGSIKNITQLDTKGRQSEDAVFQQKEEDKQEEYTGDMDRETHSAEKDEETQDCSESTSMSSTHTPGCLETSNQSPCQRTWEPTMYYTPDKEIHYFLGHKICIEESIDSYGAVIWPAAVALCKFLETPAGQQQINLLDKSVLEIGAGTGLLSIAATLLGAKLTATDLPEILSNLRYNLNRNTRRVRRHEPQIMELSWGHKLEETFPQSSHDYDYILAADVVYHHGFLAELLVTMRHFCQPGTTIIWANKIRYTSDLAFVEDFEKAFHATLIAELDEVRIYKATYRTLGGEKDDLMKSTNKGHMKKQHNYYNKETRNDKQKHKEVTKQEYEAAKEERENQRNHADEQNLAGEETPNEKECNCSRITGDIKIDTQKKTSDKKKLQQQDQDGAHEPQKEEDEVNEPQKEENEQEEHTGEKNRETEGAEKDEDSQNCSEPTSTSSAHTEETLGCLETSEQSPCQRTWEPTMYYTPDKEIHFFLGHKICIEESIDSYGAVIWPAAVALCKFLETPAGQQQINLLDKSVLEIGAGTGLLSIAATLLGAKLTATDLPEILSNLRYNLNRNTRRVRRHEPQIMELSWGHKLEETFPQSSHDYDYILAADVVYHHGFLAELLVTMRHFCQPGTTIIWANKIRYTSDLAFVEDFEKAFHATLIAELDEVRIYKATYRTLGGEKDDLMKSTNKGHMKKQHNYYNKETRNDKQKHKEVTKQEYEAAKEESENQRNHADEQNLAGEETPNEKECNCSRITGDIKIDTQKKTSDKKKLQQQDQDGAHEPQKEEDEVNEPQKEENEQEEHTGEKNRETEGAEKDEDSQNCSEPTSTSSAHTEETLGCLETSEQSPCQRTWEPTMYYTPDKEIHFFLGHKICIEESIDSYGAVIWPAAVALCKFLETPAGQQQINLLDKSVLEIGAGTGLLSIAATLLGAKLTATDLPEILSNLRYNLNRNTRRVRRHEPQIMELSWGHNLEETFPQSSHHYDYVLAADVVYHHGFLAELLVTMRHFCQPGTTIIWANKIRYTSDLAFVEDFEKAFHATLIAELDEVRIYNATHKGSANIKEVKENEKEKENWKEDKKKKGKNGALEKVVMMEQKAEEDYPGDPQGSAGATIHEKTRSVVRCEKVSEMDGKLCEERYYFAGHEIRIVDSLEPYGAATRPAALALCKFLEANPKQINLKSKAVLELGAGAGLLSIVASLLGAWVTATDKPAVLDNLSSNLSRNTRGLSKHVPQVEALSWNADLSRDFPRSTYRYDVVLAADVVNQHDLLDDLLATMRHFCQLGTRLIWANRVRTQTETTFRERFKRTFSATLLAETEEAQIYIAKTCGQRWT